MEQRLLRVEVGLFDVRHIPCHWYPPLREFGELARVAYQNLDIDAVVLLREGVRFAPSNRKASTLSAEILRRRESLSEKERSQQSG
jgi:hypothetical protein